MDILAKKHIRNNKLILAVCDADILGKKYEDNNIQLDLSGDFYKGEPTDEEQIKNLTDQADIINLVGKESTDLAIRLNIIGRAAIKEVQNIPHAQIYRL